MQPQRPREDARVSMADEIEDRHQRGEERKRLHQLEDGDQPQQLSAMWFACHCGCVSRAGENRTPEGWTCTDGRAKLAEVLHALVFVLDAREYRHMRAARSVTG